VNSHILKEELPMKMKESGIILFTENYEKAVDYYVNQIGLTLRLKKDTLSFLEFGNSYLLIEGGGAATTGEKTRQQSSVCLRIDVMTLNKQCMNLSKEA
jgi:lactoylglutathione lyase